MMADPEDFEARAEEAVTTHIMHSDVVILLGEMVHEIHRLESELENALTD